MLVFIAFAKYGNSTLRAVGFSYAKRKVHVVVFSNILSRRDHRIAKLIAEYRAEELMGAVVSYVGVT